MGNITKNEILKIVEEKNIGLVRLQFVDIVGQTRNICLPVSQLPRVLDNGCSFDGSSIEGFVRIEEADMFLKPDLDTFAILPDDIKAGKKVARFICDAYNSTGEPFEGDPRYILKKTIAEAKALGYTFNVGPEFEFYLFDLDEKGHVTTHTEDKAGYFGFGPTDKGEDARREMIFEIEKFGIVVEAAHHECGPAQHEIDFRYGEALVAADNAITVKNTIKKVAADNNLVATFMPKPVYGIAGNGMHMNMSLSDSSGKNAFYDENDPNHLSKIAYHFMAGIIKHIKGMTLICNPLVNSYKRLVPGFEAPVNIAWGTKNRSPLLRIPNAKPEATRVELRSPDPSCNPYLCFAVCLAAGLDGIKNKLVCPPAVNKNIFEMSDAEKIDYNIDILPLSLEAAINEFKNDSFLKDVLGEHVYSKYLYAKSEEWKDFSQHVTSWEVERYLHLF